MRLAGNENAKDLDLYNYKLSTYNLERKKKLKISHEPQLVAKLCLGPWNVKPNNFIFPPSHLLSESLALSGCF